MKDKPITSIQLNRLMSERGIRQIDILTSVENYCKDNGITDVKMNKSNISQYVNGSVEPRQDKLAVLCGALGVSPAYLMGLEEDETQDKKHKTLTSLSNILSTQGYEFGSNNERGQLEIIGPDGSTCDWVDESYLVSLYEEYGDDLTPANVLGTEPPQKWTPTLTEKEEKDIQKKLDNILNQLDNETGLMFDGEVVDDETKEKLRISLEMVMRGAKKEAKEKFTPKKYKK